VAERHQDSQRRPVDPEPLTRRLIRDAREHSPRAGRELIMYLQRGACRPEARKKVSNEFVAHVWRPLRVPRANGGKLVGNEELAHGIIFQAPGILKMPLP
jgi:hypothetical protein